jgi:hypothetical protein
MPLGEEELAVLARMERDQRRAKGGGEADRGVDVHDDLRRSPYS